MNQVEIIKAYELAKSRASAVGITIMCTSSGNFSIADIPKSSGIAYFASVTELTTFVYGYELGYNSGLVR